MRHPFLRRVSAPQDSVFEMILDMHPQEAGGYVHVRGSDSDHNPLRPAAASPAIADPHPARSDSNGAQSADLAPVSRDSRPCAQITPYVWQSRTELTHG